jgi:hypothetical protein
LTPFLKTSKDLSVKAAAVEGGTPMGRANVGVNLTGFRRWAKRLLGVITVPGRMEITVQTDQVLIFPKRRLSRVWCDSCGCDVVAVELQQAAKLAGLSPLALPGTAASQDWHICSGNEDEPVVCLRSLLRSLQPESRSANFQERKYEKPVRSRRYV